MKLGIEVLLENSSLINELRNQRVALLASPASVDHQLNHSIDTIVAHPEINLAAALGAQHGLKGEKQDNMIETPDELHPEFQIPVFSLYGKVRKPDKKMMDSFDVLLFDLQDVGCRIYTFITTLLYCLEACAEHKKTIWILDRPNPAGRPVEGFSLRAGNESFVGAAEIPMRHGLTVGELAHFFVKEKNLAVDYKVVAMEDYSIDEAPGFGWPSNELAWVNPSPNAPTLNMARAFPGTVLLEGTTLSEGRGTTRALELMGASDIDAAKVLQKMKELAPANWFDGALLRHCYFEPTFHKHQKQLCQGIQFHTDTKDYKHEKFSPFRLVTVFLKAVRTLYPDYPIWRDFHYEYESDRLAIDVINGSDELRLWVDDPASDCSSLDEALKSDEATWTEKRRSFMIY